MSRCASCSPSWALCGLEAREIKLLDLATHRSSLRNFEPGHRPPDPDNPLAYYDKERLYIFMRARGVRKWTTQSVYSNIGFGLLGHALATRARTDYVPLVREGDHRSAEHARHGLHAERRAEAAIHAAVSRAAGTAASSAAVRCRRAGGRGRVPVDGGRHACVGGGEPASRSPLAGCWRRTQRAGRGAGGVARTAGQRRTWTQDGLAWSRDPATGSYWHGGATPGTTNEVSCSPRARTWRSRTCRNRSRGARFRRRSSSEHVRARLKGTAPIAIADVDRPRHRRPALGLLRFAAAWWIAMIAAGTFIFGLVMALQGLALQILPRRLFLRASSFLQLGAFAVIVSVYCLQSSASGVRADRRAAAVDRSGSLLAWSPSFWFLGLFQQLTGSPAFGILATRAWVGSASSSC